MQTWGEQWLWLMPVDIQEAWDKELKQAWRVLNNLQYQAARLGRQTVFRLDA